MEIDEQKLNKRIEEIKEALGEIRRVTSLSEEEFWGDKEHIVKEVL